jgi:IclR family transcriptional regulator, acetate operon repressor
LVTGGVQSIERAFALLEAVAREGQLTLSQLAAECGLPLPTIHRLARTLVSLGYLRQEQNRQYALGPRFLLFGESSSNSVAQPHLRRLVDEIGETANLAMRDGDQVAYIAQAPGRHAMRMFTEVGRRVLPHCTAVGKVLLAPMGDEAVRQILQRTGMPRHTEHTIVDPGEFVRQLARVRLEGHAVDEGEQEVGVRCVAVAVPHPSAHLAISLSGPAPRMSDDLLARALPLLHQAAAALAAELR